MNFTSIKIEGGLISQEMLEGIAEETAQGQKPEDFGLDKNRRFLDEIGAVWSDARSYWDAFQRALARLPEDDPATTQTREQWIRPLLAALGYDGLTLFRRAADVGGRTYAISHRAGETEDAPPVHVAGFRTALDRRPRSGTPRVSPHALVQEYLNRTESLWGIVTNGAILRLLRDSPVLSRQTYIEFDLRQLMENERFSEFAVFYRLLHRTRLPKIAEDAPECLLEEYHVETVKTGGRVREKLRDGVKAALSLLGRELPLQPENSQLAERLRSGELAPDHYYRQLLRFIYRLLFLMVGEERGLVGPRVTDGPADAREIYSRFYSTRRLRDLADRVTLMSERHGDLWEGLLITLELFSNDEAAGKLGMKALDGELFGPDAIPDLEGTRLTSVHTLQAVRHLSMFEDEKKVLRRVNYGALDVEELGSVYEGLLEYHPRVSMDGDKVAFDLVSGSERKTTGSYYTPRELVQELIKSALVPVIEDRLKDKKTKEERREALLSISVCDPASGSGHFLLAAARRIGWELARVESGEESPNPSDVRACTREVIRRCIYGVDINPLAVDLCKVALWIEGHCPDKPLSFLDHRIKCGNSLVGLMPDVHGTPIPNEAYKPLSDDDKQVAAQARARNSTTRSQWRKAADDFFAAEQRTRGAYARIAAMPDDTPEQVHAKEKAWAEYQKSSEYQREKLAADLWCAPFFWGYGKDGDAPVSGDVLDTFGNVRQIPASLRRKVEEMAEERAFFHWKLAFPDVSAKGGFDCVLGNPPWERIKLQEQEFFASRDTEIAEAPNKAARQRLIDALSDNNPLLATAFAEAKHGAEAQSKFVRESGRFPLTAVGDVNTYALFAEQFKALLSDRGRAGVVCQTGIATDDSTKKFFGDISRNQHLASLFDFENREGIFPDVDSRMKFCLLTVSGGPVPSGDFAFFLTDVEHLKDQMRRFKLSADDIALLNPNTRTCPVFRTQADAELTKSIYRRVPVLVNEATGENPRGVSFRRVFDMNKVEVLRLCERQYQPGLVPMYEAKMIWNFDHRFGTYEGVPDRSSTHIPTPSREEHADPQFVVQPWYWVRAEEVEARWSGWKRGWLLGFRDITNATNERTAVASFLPFAGTDFSIRLAFPATDCRNVLFLGSALNSLPLDYLARQMVAGTHLSDYISKQLPFLPSFASHCWRLIFVVPRVLELTYAAWDIKAFGDDVWHEADDELREAIRWQWEENKAATGGHEWNPPEWTETPRQARDVSPEDGIPLPPFKWDEDRRAVLRAELDAYYAKLYGLNRKQLRYILDPHGLSKKELEDILSDWEDPTCSGAHLLPSEPDLDFPGETFRVLKQKEEKHFKEYRTRRLILEAWERLHAQGLMPEPYDQRKDPNFQRPAASSQESVSDAETARTASAKASADKRGHSATSRKKRSAAAGQHSAGADGGVAQHSTLDTKHPQGRLMEVPASPRLEMPDIVPGETRVTVNGAPGTALGCKEDQLQGEPALRWIVKLENGETKSFYSPPAQVEVLK